MTKRRPKPLRCPSCKQPIVAPPPTPDGRVIGYEAFAGLLGTSQHQVRRWVKQGRLPAPRGRRPGPGRVGGTPWWRVEDVPRQRPRKLKSCKKGTRPSPFKFKLTKRDFAKAIKVTRPTLLAWLKKGKVPPPKLRHGARWFFTPDQVAEFNAGPIARRRQWLKTARIRRAAKRLAKQQLPVLRGDM